MTIFHCNLKWWHWSMLVLVGLVPDRSSWKYALYPFYLHHFTNCFPWCFSSWKSFFVKTLFHFYRSLPSLPVFIYRKAYLAFAPNPFSIYSIPFASTSMLFALLIELSCGPTRRGLHHGRRRNLKRPLWLVVGCNQLFSFLILLFILN